MATWHHRSATTGMKKVVRKHSSVLTRLIRTWKVTRSRISKSKYNVISIFVYREAFCYDVYVHISSFKLTLNRLSAEDALNSQNAIYKTKLDIFVDNVSIQVVERHLVDPLGENLFSPHAILRLTDEKVSLLAAEPLNATRKRDTLEERKKILEMGVKIFKEALNSSTDGL